MVMLLFPYVHDSIFFSSQLRQRGFGCERVQFTSSGELFDAKSDGGEGSFDLVQSMAHWTNATTGERSLYSVGNTINSLSTAVQVGFGLWRPYESRFEAKPNSYNMFFTKVGGREDEDGAGTGQPGRALCDWGA